MFISSYANALGHLGCFTFLHNPFRVSYFHCSFHHFLVDFIISLLISSCANALGHLVCFTLLLNPSRVTYFHYSFHHLITYILGSLIFKRMLDLWVYTFKACGFIHSSLSDSFFPKIM